MPYFVTTRPPSPEELMALQRRQASGLRRRLASIVASAAPATSTARLQLLAGTGDGSHETREEAERELRRKRRDQPEFTHVIVEASNHMEALVRASTPDGSLPPLEVQRVESWSQMQNALALRQRVFVLEQGIAEVEEIDEYDLPRAWGATVVQLLGTAGERLQMPVATGRLRIDVDDGDLPLIGRVAVAPEFRRLGYGTALMRALEDEARQRGYPGVTLAAQLHAIPFYASLGYIEHGPTFLDAGVEHRQMDLRWG